MAPPSSTLHLDVEAISGICGSVSIACWVVVFSPQIIQNFQRSNADALSIQFIIVWLLGDVFNIIGAVLQGVLPTMIILAIYYTLADLVLLAQCFYYRGFTWRDEPVKKRKTPTQPDEHTALLGEPRERRGSDWTGLSPAVPHIPEPPSIPPPPPTTVQTLFWNSTIVLMVCAAGVLGWYLGEQAKDDHKDKLPESAHNSLEFNVLGQFFGYLCTIAYVASRLPQLILNYRRKTTDGLSMLFFLFACLGNITYALSIFAYDPKCEQKHCKQGEASRIYSRYLLVNLSWLLGSLTTLVLDFAVFAQFFMYKNENEQDDQEALYVEEEEDEILAEGRNGHVVPDTRPLLQRADSSNHAR